MTRKLIEGSSDEMAGLESGNMNDYSSFSEKSVRLGFIRKVYGILTVQLVVTLTIMSLIIFIEPFKLYCQQNAWLLILAFVVTFTSIIVLACCPGVRRSYPSNMIFLGVFTICEGFLLGISTSYYNREEVFIAVGVTCLIVFGLTMFAFQTKIDFTILNGALFILLIILMIFGLLCAFIQNNYLNLFYACIGALLFSLYVLVDTQMIAGGNHRYTVSPEEYIFAALNLYLDIINLFLLILDIVHRSE